MHASSFSIFPNSHSPFSFSYPNSSMQVMSTNSNNCGNASNPYHQCTQACFQNSKGNKAQSNRKSSSSYGRSVTDGDLGKKVINGERRSYPGCPKASNPYHTCDANCNKSSSNSGATLHSKIDHRKKVGSKPEPPILHSVPTKKNGTTNNLSNSNASSTKPHYSENKKDEIIPSSGPISAQLHISDVMPKEQVKDSVAEDKVVASDETVPITTYSVETGSKDFSFSDTPVRLKNNNKEVDTSSDGETDSVMSESRIQIGKYNVKESFGSILQTILDKYGDIGASCDLESVVMRSYYMECVCFVVQELQSSSDSLTKSKLNELLDIVKDIESAHLRIAWLRNTLDEIAENIELVRQHQDTEIEKANNDREMKSLREKLESELVTLAEKEQEIADIHMRIPEIRDRLKNLEQLESPGLVDEQTMLPIKSKIDQLL